MRATRSLAPLAITAAVAHVWALIETWRYQRAIDNALYEATLQRYPEP